MMRLDEKFRQLREKKQKAFIAYVPFGLPDTEATLEICSVLQEAGVDIIELGFPFSDPLADGLIIQEAMAFSLARGATMDNFFKLLPRLSARLDIPVVVMTYYNPVFRFGINRFLAALQAAGMGAALIVDVPVEEAGEYIRCARRHDIDTVFFATPTTSRERIKKIAKLSKGFLYYISVTGITGPQALAYTSIARHIQAIKSVSAIPVCVGFGIHTRSQVKMIGSISDGVIVGSSIVRFIMDHYQRSGFLKALKTYVHALCSK